MKILKIILIFLLPLNSFCQEIVSGIVISKSDKLPIPGVIIQEKGTQNGCLTNMSGEFILSVKDLNSTIVFSFVGFEPKEIELKGRDRIEVILRESCNIDWFDYSQWSFSLMSGIFSTPIGGQIDLPPPPIKSFPVLKSSIGYQSNFKKNSLLVGNIGLYHLFESCDFNSGIIFSLKNLKFQDEFKSTTAGLETNLNFNKLGLIVGISRLKIEKNDLQYRLGPTLGFRLYPKKPLWLGLSGKISFYKNYKEINFNLERDFKKFGSFIRFNNISTFNELTFGLSKTFNHHEKKNNSRK
ncbi:MAG: carboxypeptidase-like regulatory domain-containing protein [Cytophagaceae bacterium]|nr:carboxypeptidase-like regulatory domain-containing protein [Cytophagaceae bacterium]